MGTHTESSMSIALTIYKTAVDRAMYGYPTRKVYLPPALFETLKADEIQWLGREDLLGLEIAPQEGLTQPLFVDT
jgi:hypothetical protein